METMCLMLKYGFKCLDETIKPQETQKENDKQELQVSLHFILMLILIKELWIIYRFSSVIY